MAKDLNRIYKYIVRIISNSKLNAKETELLGSILMEFCDEYFNEYSLNKEINFEWLLDCVATRVFGFEMMYNGSTDIDLMNRMADDKLRIMFCKLMMMCKSVTENNNVKVNICTV